MNQLLWDTYRKNASTFVHEWAHERDEKGEAHSYWDAFLKIFNLERRRFARHEGRVKREGNRQGFIDLIWKGKMLVEHKSAHLDKPEDFDKTFRQAMEYVDGLPPEERPRRVVLCNFKRFRIYNLDDKKAGGFVEIAIAKLPQRLAEFAFIPEFAGELIEKEEKANLDAVSRIASIHKVLKSSHYTGHDLELLLVRMLFCMFAEDTGIFEPKQFSKYILNNTLENGSDNRIAGLIKSGRLQAYRAINAAMTATYWEIGRLIVEEEQQGRERAGYGDYLIRELSKRLKKEFGSGCSVQSLWNYRQFYLQFPMLSAVRRELTWTHYRLLMRVENPEARAFYEAESTRCGWSTRALERQIGAFYYERLLASGDRSGVEAEAA